MGRAVHLGVPDCQTHMHSSSRASALMPSRAGVSLCNIS